MPTITRERCYACFRPRGDCFCAAIPRIDNRTEVLILQHVHERFHPFNTARIVRRALANSSLLVDQTSCLAARLALRSRAGLLYPGAEATLIGDLPLHRRTEQLVVLDGTWHHVKTFLRDIPALCGLPRYRLAPTSPSRYRIRREPSAAALSTVEAIVAALRVLEPETAGWDQLLAAFDCMVERQLAHPKAEYGWRRNTRRNRTALNIPLALLGDLDNVVVAYAESAAGERGTKRSPRPPVYWVAQRLGSGEQFACAIQPDAPLQEAFLRHLELSQNDFAAALTPAEACRSWAEFQRPGDTLAVYQQSTATLLSCIAASFASCLVLKSVDLQSDRSHGTLDELLAAEGIAAGPAQHPSRAGKRLANAVAYVRHLIRLAGKDASLDRSIYKLDAQASAS